MTEKAMEDMLIDFWDWFNSEDGPAEFEEAMRDLHEYFYSENHKCGPVDNEIYNVMEMRFISYCAGRFHPIYETPEQYKARTGKEWPDRSVVYWRARHKSSGIVGKWGYDLFGEFRKEDMLNDPNFEFDVLISTEAGCPPDGWMPE